MFLFIDLVSSFAVAAAVALAVVVITVRLASSPEFLLLSAPKLEPVFVRVETFLATSCIAWDWNAVFQISL